MSDPVIEETAQQIAADGRAALVALLRPAFNRQAGSSSDVVTLDYRQLEQLIEDAADRADGVLWRRALAQVACYELGISLGQAAAHPAVQRAHELVGAPPYVAPAGTTPAAPTLAEPSSAAPTLAEPSAPASAPASSQLEPHALRLAAVHLDGIETVRAGDRDIELRLSADGLDVLKRSSGAAIGRLEWAEIQKIDLPRSRRGLRLRRRRVQELHVTTDRGQASFALPGLTDEQRQAHLEPMIERVGAARD
jgi:hypothetical protein